MKVSHHINDSKTLLVTRTEFEYGEQGGQSCPAGVLYQAYEATYDGVSHQYWNRVDSWGEMVPTSGKGSGWTGSGPVFVNAPGKYPHLLCHLFKQVQWVEGMPDNLPTISGLRGVQT